MATTKKYTFPTPYNYIDTVVRTSTEPGSDVAPTFELSIDSDTGVENLVQTGETNVYNLIQSYADSVDINLLIQRYELGDHDAINKLQGFFADCASTPTDLLSALEMNRKGEQLFKQLDPETRAVFGDDYARFLGNQEDWQTLQNKMSQVYAIDTDEVISDDDKE